MYDTNVLYVEDLKNNKYVRWQKDYYHIIAPFMGIILPTIVCALWGDLYNGFFVAGIVKSLIVYHGTWCINSLAHFPLSGILKFLSSKTYDSTLTPVDNIICAFVTGGEGYHNFHHEFPNDYRNGIFWYHYDPTKWLIKACSYIG